LPFPLLVRARCDFDDVACRATALNSRSKAQSSKEAMPNRRVTDHKPQYTPPALFFELEREFKDVGRE
jgi:hypothetical protein